jgi:hypothetical protein
MKINAGEIPTHTKHSHICCSFGLKPSIVLCFDRETILPIWPIMPIMPILFQFIFYVNSAHFGHIRKVKKGEERRSGGIVLINLTFNWPY